MRLAFLLALVGCNHLAGGGDDATTDGDAARDGHTPGVTDVFDPAVTDVVVEIDYETGEAPYTGPIVGFGDTFDVTVTNIDRLLAHKKHLTIPRVLADMTDIGVVSDEQLTVDDLLALAAQHRTQHDTPTTKTYYVVFVSGYFTDASGPNNAVLGISLGDTGVVAMFKDVIRSTDIGVPNVVRYVEQASMTHELGHSVGLVANGVAMVAPHRDTAHGAHCSNNACVMYWQIDGTNGAAAYAQAYVTSGNTILFDDACLADVDARSGGL